MLNIKVGDLITSYPKTYKGIKDMFSKHEKCFVAFEKKDGSIREMLCTTMLSMIPDDMRPKSAAEPEPPTSYEYDPEEPDPTYYNVFDLEINQWRSFVIDRLITWGGV